MFLHATGAAKVSQVKDLIEAAAAELVQLQHTSQTIPHRLVLVTMTSLIDKSPWLYRVECKLSIEMLAMCYILQVLPRSLSLKT